MGKFVVTAKVEELVVNIAGRTQRCLCFYACPDDGGEPVRVWPKQIRALREAGMLEERAPMAVRLMIESVREELDEGAGDLSIDDCVRLAGELGRVIDLLGGEV